MAELLYRLGRFSARRAWVVFVSWLGVLAVVVGGFLLGFGSLSSSFSVPDTPSSQVIDRLGEELPDMAGAAGTVVFHTEDGSPLTDEQRAQISERIASSTELSDVASAVDPFATQQQQAESAQQLADSQAQIEAGTAQLDAAQAQLDAARAQLEAVGQPTDSLNEQQAQLDSSRAELEAGAEQANQAQELLSYSEGIRLVSDDESAALGNVSFNDPQMELSEDAKNSVIDHFLAEPIDGVEVDFSTAISQSIPQILGIGEAVGVVIAAVVLLVMLGSLIAASFPIVTALVGVATGVLAALSFSSVVQMTSVTPVLGVMLGLAVGIDYSLFIVHRHRKQLVQGAEVRESVALSNGTAGNAVVFAGSTVVIALLALNITGIPFLGLMGTVGAVCVAVAVLVAITLTPALLGTAGERILSRKARAKAATARAAWDEVAKAEAIASETGREPAPVPDPTGPKHGKTKNMPTWRAVVTSVVAVIALLVVAVPALSVRLGLPDGASEPEGSTANEAFTIVEEKFGAGANSPILVAADMPEAVAEGDLVSAQAEVAGQLAEFDDVVAVAPVGTSDDATMLAFQIIPTGGPNSVSTADLVHDLRAIDTLDGGASIGVAGQAAINIDISQSLQDILPLYLVVVVGLSLLIMILVFRSFLVPLIATGGFVLSLFATLGAVVAVFQWGWLDTVFGITSTGPILSFLPVILVGILFGLAMDYQIFLASGMREAFVHGSNARDAVTRGFRAGRSVVIAAGLIMVSVFGGFVFSDSAMIKVMGFGLAFGVLVDAFIVRLLLMPALMHLIGKAAWWLPKWVDKIVPNVDVEGSALERRHQLH